VQAESRRLSANGMQKARASGKQKASASGEAPALPLAGEGAEEGRAFRWGRGTKVDRTMEPLSPSPDCPTILWPSKIGDTLLKSTAIIVKN